MDRDETLDPGIDWTWQPPPGSGIEVDEGDDGARITLPRLYSQRDVIAAVVLAALAAWMAVWVDAMAADATGSSLGRAVMAGVGLIFGFLAVSEAVPIAAPRVIEDRGDRIVLSRAVGVRLVLRRTIRKSGIRSVERVWEEGGGETGAAGVVRVRTDRHDYRLGKGLDPTAALWLEEAVRAMAEG